VLLPAGGEPTDAGTGQPDVGVVNPDGGGPGDAADDGALGSDGSVEAEPGDASGDVAPPPAITCADAPGLQPGSPWPIAGRCSARAGSTRALGPTTTPTVAWQATNDAGWSVSDLVVAADGTIYTGDGNGNVVALAPGGSIRWKTPLVPGAIAGPLFFAIGADGTVYASDGVLAAYRPNGTLAWSTVTSPDLANFGPALGPDGTIYAVGTETLPGDVLEGTLTAVDPNGGKRWQVPFGVAEPFGSPAVGANGTVYVVVATMTGTVLDAFTPQGDMAWSEPLNGGSPANDAVYGAPVVVGDDGTVYAPCAGGVCTFTADGKPLATFGGTPMSGIALAPDVSLVYATFDSNSVTAFATDGGTAWTYANATPGIYEKALVLTDGHGSAYAFNGGYSYPPVMTTIAADGGLLWTAQGSCLAMAADGTMYCISSDYTTITALSP
jgi:PQQ-like domain